MTLHRAQWSLNDELVLDRIESNCDGGCHASHKEIIERSVGYRRELREYSVQQQEKTRAK